MPRQQNALRWVARKKTSAKVYITRVFNFGTLEEWRAMKKDYSRKAILEAVRHPLSGQWMPRAKSFAETLFGIRMPQQSLISYDA